MFSIPWNGRGIGRFGERVKRENILEVRQGWSEDWAWSTRKIQSLTRTDSTKILFLYLCVSKSVCLHVLMCACVLVCVCMLVQVCIPIHIQKRLEKGVSCLPILFSIYFFEAGSFSEVKIHFLRFAASPCDPPVSIHLGAGVMDTWRIASLLCRHLLFMILQQVVFTTVPIAESSILPPDIGLLYSNFFLNLI